ncbi:hypothetical protein WJX82_002267 [Trebouxia sp. C0006]
MVPEHVNCNAARQNRKYRSELTLERQAGFRVISKTAHTLYRRSSAGFDSLAEVLAARFASIQGTPEHVAESNAASTPSPMSQDAHCLFQSNPDAISMQSGSDESTEEAESLIAATAQPSFQTQFKIVDQPWMQHMAPGFFITHRIALTSKAAVYAASSTVYGQ